MHSTPSVSKYPAIREWEEARTSLSRALENYLRLSYSLSTSSLAEGTTPAYLVKRIESATASFHIKLHEQLREVQSVLGQTRNQVISPSYRLPEEILSQVFLDVQLALIPPRGVKSDMLERTIINGYRALYILLGVCSRWRSVALSQGKLWTLVPHFSRSGNASIKLKQAVERIIQLSKGADLRLFAVDPASTSSDLSYLTAHAAQFSTANFVTSYFDKIHGITEMFSDQHARKSLRLRRLSIYRNHYFDRLPEDDDYAFRPPSENISYEQLFQQLYTLNLRGGIIRWEMLAFAKRLTVLHLRDMVLGYDSALTRLLKALSSATRLRELTLINVKTYLDPSPPRDLLAHSTASLPHLQSIVIQGLYFNTWRLLLLSIRSRAHRPSFIFTSNSRRFAHGDDTNDSDVDIETICEPLERTPVHLLLLESEQWTLPHHIISPGELEKLLGVMWALETLWINRWDLGRRYCRALHRARKKNSDNLLSLVNMYFTAVEFPSPEAFENMVKGYSASLQRVAVGGSCDLINSVGPSISPEGELASWLQKNVPEFKLADADFGPPELQGILWREIW